VVLCPRQMEGAAAKLQEEDGAHLGQRALACVQWDSKQSGTKWRCTPGRERGHQPSSRRRMRPTWVREWSGTKWSCSHSSSLLERPGKGMEGGGGRRVVEAYHHQLQVAGVVKSLHSVFRCGVCGHEGHETASCLRVSKPVV